MKTWEVKLLAGNNGVIQTNVVADDWHEVENASGDAFAVSFYKRDSVGDETDVAFFPMASLLSIKDVTP